MRLQDTLGMDPTEFARVTQEFVAEANRTPGIANVFTTFQAATPQIFVDVDRGVDVLTACEGMVLTVEPGLYFQEDDLLVPEELRGIGIRIEDDIVVTADTAATQSISVSLKPDKRLRRAPDGGGGGYK